MHFYLRPGSTKSRFLALIEGGGGVMCRVQEPGAILLADPKELTGGAAQGYISTQYVLDCLERNKQLDLDSYRLDSVQSEAGKDPPARKKERSLTGRMLYTKEEDAAILRYVRRRRNEVKGNSIWQAMAREGITGHSWQSMKDRYRKQLVDQQQQQEEEEEEEEPVERRATRQFIFESRTLEKSPEVAKVPEVSQGPPADSDLVRDPGEEEEQQEDEEEEKGEEEHVRPVAAVEKTLREIENRLEQQNQPVNKPQLKRKQREEGPSEVIPVHSTPKQNPFSFLWAAIREFESDDETPDLVETEKPPGCPSIPESGFPVPSQEQGVQDTDRPSQPQPRPPRTSLREFVMNMDSQPQLGEMSIAPDHEEPPEAEVEEAKEAMSFLMEESGMDLVRVMQALLKNNGDFQAARSYLLSGHRADVCPLWTHQDDCLLLSGNPSAQQTLIEKYGQEAVAVRLAFLSDSAC
ncbi:telomeric repeat-binding factor 2-interacting protein 1 isoform X2 [Amia ocellicauda]